MLQIYWRVQHWKNFLKRLKVMNERPVVCMSSQLTELQNCCIAIAKGIKIYGQTTVGLYESTTLCE